MWKRYFKFIKLKPGKVVTAQFGEIDFSADNIGIEIIQALYENGFPYLELTEQGKVKFYPVVSKRENMKIISIPKREKSRISKTIILTN